MPNWFKIKASHIYIDGLYPAEMRMALCSVTQDYFDIPKMSNADLRDLHLTAYAESPGGDVRMAICLPL